MSIETFERKHTIEWQTNRFGLDEMGVIQQASSIQLKPAIVTESVDGVRIGKIVLRVEPILIFETTKEFDRFFNALNGPDYFNEDLRRSITFSLNHNTPNPKSPVAHERPVSAYFTFDPNEEAVIVEWGTIDPNNQEAKLHSFLNRGINFAERHAQGMKISSGHLAKLLNTPYHVALFDNLSHGPTKQISIQTQKTINTLYTNGIIPITADGYVQLPAFGV